MKRESKKRGVAVVGAWLPVPLDFLRSRACAEISPSAAKLLLDVFSMLGANASRNGDISLTPKLMRVRGWTSRESLGAAVRELVEFGLLARTRQGSRLDCALFACTLYPLDCDLSKLDVKPGSYRHSDYMGESASLAKAPSEERLAVWRRARKSKTLAPSRDERHGERPAAGQSHPQEGKKRPGLSRHETKPPGFTGANVPPRGTYLD